MTAMRALKQASALSIALWLAGCTTVGPDFSRPEAAWLPQWSGVTWRSLAEAAPHRDAAQNEEWWRAFEDPALEWLVAEAQRKNPAVVTAGLRIMEARAALGIANSTLYPQLQQVTGQLLRTNKSTGDVSGNAFWSTGIGFDLGWEIDFWGKFRRGIESADAAYFASIAQYDDMQVLMAAQAASMYASLRTIELRLDIAHENAALQQRSLEITERLFRSGQESELDVQQARSQYLGTLATIPEIEDVLRRTQNALCVLIARPPGPLPELDGGRARIPQAPIYVAAEMPASLLRRRPDVRAAELQLAAQSAQIGISEAALYPSIALAGSVGLSNTSSTSSLGTMRGWFFGPTLVWDVFDHGRLKNQVLVQDARFQQLYEQYQDVVLRAARELDDAATDFVQGRAQVDILRDAVKAARRSLDIANLQYREGLTDFQRVLDSQRALFNQQERLVDSEGNVAQSLVAMYKAMGGGWEPGRLRPAIDSDTQEMMGRRSDWDRLLEAPLPPAATEFLPPASPDTR
jgi:NodT family efflux transporter outer membrane factor (OMF) lipoprotein